MIVRIMGQGQYRVDSSLADKLNDIDNRIVSHVTKGDQNGFRKDLAKLGFKALMCGTLASYLSATIAGILS